MNKDYCKVCNCDPCDCYWGTNDSSFLILKFVKDIVYFFKKSKEG